MEFVHEKALAYFSDVHDHVLRLASDVGKLRDLLTSILEANLIRVSIRQNDDMRKISAWVAIAAVPTLLAGIYGMNFEHMPELWGVVRLPACHRHHGGDLRLPLPTLPQERLALTGGVGVGADGSMQCGPCPSRCCDSPGRDSRDG